MKKPSSAVPASVSKLAYLARGTGTFGTPGATPIAGNLTPKHYAQGHAGRREALSMKLPTKREVRSFGD